MKPGLITSHLVTQFHGFAQTNLIWRHYPIPFLSCSSLGPISVTSLKKTSRCWLTICSSNTPKSSEANRESTTNRMQEALNANLAVQNDEPQQNRWSVEVGSPSVPSHVPTPKLSLSDQAFFLLAFIGCTTSAAFVSLVIAAVPTLYAIGRAAVSLSKLADTAREELPSTMAAIRLSGMEISDLTLELSDLSQEISDGVSKSAQAVQAAEAGIRQIGSLAHQQTTAMIQERANLPIISLQPFVAGAAKKTSRAVGQATKTFTNILSGGDVGSKNQNESTIDGLEI